jgi:hypothetical protein
LCKRRLKKFVDEFPNAVGPQAEVVFLFFRVVTPVLSLAISAFYTFVVTHFALAVTLKMGIIVLATYTGLKMPELYLKNKIDKRQHSSTLKNIRLRRDDRRLRSPRCRFAMPMVRTISAPMAFF